MISSRAIHGDGRVFAQKLAVDTLLSYFHTHIGGKAVQTGSSWRYDSKAPGMGVAVGRNAGGVGLPYDQGIAG